MRQERILIVDDEETVRDVVTALLERSGYATTAVASAEEALTRLQQDPDYDLVLSDIIMPGIDGLNLLEQICTDYPSLPVVMCSAVNDVHVATNAFRRGAIDYVLKPIEKNRLARAIQRAKKALEAEASPSERLETLVNQIGSVNAPPVKLLVKTQQRLFLVDAEDVIFASIEDGTITVVAREVEGISNYRTIEELQSTLESDVFWRAHRSYLVNINHIKEVVPWFKSSYMLKMNDKRASEVPVSRAQTRHLRELLKM